MRILPLNKIMINFSSFFFSFESYWGLTVCSYYVTDAFQSEFTIYSCLNVKEFLARNRCDIWSLIDCNGTRTHNHLVHKQTLNSWAFVYKLGGCGFEFRCSHLIKFFYFFISLSFNTMMSVTIYLSAKINQFIIICFI